MKKLWMLCILFLTTVSTATENPLKDIIFYVEEPILIIEQYYPLYDSGVVVDSAVVYEFEGLKVTKEMYTILEVMLDSAMSDSVEIKVNSAYRTFEEQLECRKRNAHRKHKTDTTYLLTAKSTKFSPVTAKPGWSAHQLGIAFDFDTSDKETFNWLKENALKFGFVRTVKKERWHWEYLPDVKNPYQFVKEKHWSWKTNIKT